MSSPLRPAFLPPASRAPLAGLTLVLGGAGALASFSSHAVPSAVAATRPTEKKSASSASLTRLVYLGMPAFQLSDGVTRAIIVPRTGRVMFYGNMWGQNQLWTNRRKASTAGQWHNWGGDKTWPAPQTLWPLTNKYLWPPAPAWDGLPHKAEIISNTKLRLSSGIWPGINCRLVRDYYYDGQGQFCIRQTVTKTAGQPVELSIWDIAQVPAPEAIFVTGNPESPYKDNFHWLLKPKAASQSQPPVSSLAGGLLKIQGGQTQAYKLGIDSPRPALAVVNGGLAFLQRANPARGQYPDGALGSGFPVEIFDSAAHGQEHYVETELLSPLRRYYAGTSWTQTIFWSLHELPSRDLRQPETLRQIRRLLTR